MDELDTGWIDDSLWAENAYEGANGEAISPDQFGGTSSDTDTSIGEGIDLTQSEMDAWDAMQSSRYEAMNAENKTAELNQKAADAKEAMEKSNADYAKLQNALAKANSAYHEYNTKNSAAEKGANLIDLHFEPVTLSNGQEIQLGTYKGTDPEIAKIIEGRNALAQNIINADKALFDATTARGSESKEAKAYNEAVKNANDAAARAEEYRANANAARAEWDRVYEESRAAGLEEKAAKEAADKAAQEKLNSETRGSSGTLNVSQEVANSFIEAANKNDTSTLEQMLVNGQLTPSQAITMADKQVLPQEIKNWLYEYLYKNGSMSEGDYNWLSGQTNSDVNSANVMRTFGYNNRDSAATDMNNAYNKGLTEKATNVVSDAMKKIVIYQPYVRKAVKKW